MQHAGLWSAGQQRTEQIMKDQRAITKMDLAQARQSGFMSAMKYSLSAFTLNHVLYALEIGERLASQHGTENDQQRFAYAKKLLNAMPRPTGCFVDGHEVQPEAIYGDLDKAAEEMKRYGCD